MGVSYINAFVAAAMMFAWSASGATLSAHHHDSAADERTKSALMRRDVQGIPEKVEPVMVIRKRQRVSFRQRDRFMEVKKRGQTVRSLEGVKYTDLCNYQYEEGPANTNACARAQTQTIIESESTCKTAAELFCPCTGDGCTHSCVGTNFRINDPYLQNYSMGCFIDSDNDNKWYWNPVGGAPANPRGTPVCKEVEFVDGTVGSMSTCPAGYTSVVDEYTCRTAAACLDYCTHQQFRVLAAADEMLNPKGCHVAADGCLAFNNATVDPTCGSGTPCRGKPMCNVTTPYTAGAAGGAGATAAGATAAAATR